MVACRLAPTVLLRLLRRRRDQESTAVRWLRATGWAYARRPDWLRAARPGPRPAGSGLLCRRGPARGHDRPGLCLHDDTPRTGQVWHADGPRRAGTTERRRPRPTNPAGYRTPGHRDARGAPRHRGRAVAGGRPPGRGFFPGGPG